MKQLSQATTLILHLYFTKDLKKVDALIREAAIMHGPKTSMASYVMFILRKCAMSLWVCEVKWRI